RQRWPLANLASARNCAALPVWLLCFLSLGFGSGTCSLQPTICSSEPWRQFCPCRGSKDEQWDLSSPEFRTGLGFNPDGAFPAWLSRASKAPACRWHLFLGVWG